MLSKKLGPVLFQFNCRQSILYSILLFTKSNCDYYLVGLSYSILKIIPHDFIKLITINSGGRPFKRKSRVCQKHLTLPQFEVNFLKSY